MSEILIDVGPPRSGKTERLVEWVAAGNETVQYPFWSRVILVETRRQADLLRRRLAELMPTNDTYRFVFEIAEWQSARIGANDVEVAIDNAEGLLGRIVGPRGVLATVTMTGRSRP